MQIARGDKRSRGGFSRIMDNEAIAIAVVAEQQHVVADVSTKAVREASIDDARDAGCARAVEQTPIDERDDHVVLRPYELSQLIVTHRPALDMYLVRLGLSEEFVDADRICVERCLVEWLRFVCGIGAQRRRQVFEAHPKRMEGVR